MGNSLACVPCARHNRPLRNEDTYTKAIAIIDGESVCLIHLRNALNEETETGWEGGPST